MPPPSIRWQRHIDHSSPADHLCSCSQALPHARAVARCTAQARTIRLTPPSNDSESPLINLSEEVLIQKANLALELAHKHGGPIPLDAQFIAARKTTHKNVLYEVDSEDTVAWLWSPEGQRLFASTRWICLNRCESKWTIGSVLQPKHNTKKTKIEYWFACAELDRSCTERGTTPRGLMQQKSRGSSGLQRWRRMTRMGLGLRLSLGQRLVLE